MDNKACILLPGLATHRTGVTRCHGRLVNLTSIIQTATFELAQVVLDAHSQRANPLIILQWIVNDANRMPSLLGFTLAGFIQTIEDGTGHFTPLHTHIGLDGSLLLGAQTIKAALVHRSHED